MKAEDPVNSVQLCEPNGYFALYVFCAQYTETSFEQVEIAKLYSDCAAGCDWVWLHLKALLSWLQKEFWGWKKKRINHPICCVCCCIRFVISLYKQLLPPPE